MVLKLKDKNGTIMTYRKTTNGAVLTKGKRELHILFKSVNQGKKAREVIANNSFNKLFTKGKKVRALGFCGTINPDDYRDNFKKTFYKFLDSEYDGIKGALKQHGFLSNGAEVVVNDMLKRVNR